jgi:hypothetical protein
MKERRHVGVGHRRVMPARELRALRQDLIEVATPARRVLAGALAFDLRGVEHPLGAPAQPRPVSDFLVQIGVSTLSAS